MLFSSRKNEYVDNEGAVRYLDGSNLERPLEAPMSQRLIMAAFVAIAIAVGGYLLFLVLDNVQGAAAREQSSIADNLSRDVSYDLPLLYSLVALDDATIQQIFIDSGYTTQVTSTEGDFPSGGFELVKLPSDMNRDEAVLLYDKKDSLDAADAALLLNGSWTLTVDRAEGMNMRLSYADFSSGSIDAAIENAMVTEGFDPASIPEDGQGIDEVGNTYKSGTIDTGAGIYTWRVSTIALSSIYNVSGLPESAVYVGIRLTS